MTGEYAMQTSWLIPFDGSDHSRRALELAISEAKSRHIPPALFLLNVQTPLPSDITRFIDSKTVDDYHREEGEKALAWAQERLSGSSLIHSFNILVGDVPKTILEIAASTACSMIIMGAHGHGSVKGLVVGSVTTKVLHSAPVPVLLVK
jgi:nucleotide-binding universal stress UspA family protein